ncbi:hypothetical protein FRC07_006287 [Ceratobasidium sp. 392]|nr:hypothetical protein FRC07_006287 [Ceratobasidium sp. 392]
MRFTVFTALLAYATIGLLQLVNASPILDTKDMVVKRDNADILAALNTLKGNVDPILAEIDGLVAAHQANLTAVTPLIAELTSALDVGAAQLGTLSPASLRKRQTDDELANLVAGIINSIGKALQGLVEELGDISLLAGLLAGVDASLNQVLLGLGILLKGVLNLVANLFVRSNQFSAATQLMMWFFRLTNVAQLLRNLALGLSLGTLGL